MKKISLIATLFLGILLLENCKKDTVTATATSNALLVTSINDTTWTPTADSITASLTYNAASGTKVFACAGISDNKEIKFFATKKGGNTAGFPITSYFVDSTQNVSMSYLIKQKDANGNSVFLPQGTVGPGSGTIIVTAIDSVKKLITGTFSFTSVKNNLDSNGNIISINVAQITSGAFNSLPYTFTSN
jgi:hypothetical protein